MPFMGEKIKRPGKLNLVEIVNSEISERGIYPNL